MVRLRRGGSKRPREEVRAAVPVRGDLTVSIHRGVRMATLLPMEKHSEFLYLERCQLTQMRGASFVMVGIEADGHRADSIRYEQAWWCQVSAGEQLALKQLFDLAPDLNRDERRAARMAR